MGLSQVAQAVSFLNVDCKMVSPFPWGFQAHGA
jgi:hypothetical protein